MKKQLIMPLTIALLFVMVFVVSGTTLAKHHESKNPYIGVYAHEIDEELVEAFDLSTDEGIVVVDVIDGSPASEAGLEEADIIVKFDGQKVDGSVPLKDFVVDKNVGDEVKIEYLRGKRKKTITLEIGSRPMDREKQIWIEKDGPGTYSRSWTTTIGKSGYIGVSIQDLNDQLGDYFGVENGEGVLIVEVFEDSPADKAGMKAGDVIIGVDGDGIAKSQDLQEVISEKEEGDKVDIEFLRKGSKKVLKVDVEEDEHGMNAFVFPDMDFKCMPMQFDKNMKFKFFGDDEDFDEDIIIRKGRVKGGGDHDVIIHKGGDDEDIQDIYIRKFIIDEDEDEDGNVIIRKFEVDEDSNTDEEIKELRDELKAMRKELREIKEKLDKP